ncbi:MAG: DEAD/DEAH box helicase [Sulfuritalea sp.]|nr:DEAD/DEAH box helicase [Sulfuritalea sp.]
MSVPLRDYQAETVERAREAIRAGARNVLICAPTGAGKTQIASHLIHEAKGKGRRANFVVDRLSLLNQTSEVFDGHGIDHGVVQSQHERFSPSKPVQVCSIQTVTRRSWPDSALDVIDEAHVLHEAVKKRIKGRDRITLGLTATPFTKGLGKHFDAIINVTTTNKLIEQNWLSPYRIFSCAEPNMDGVKVTKLGEWDSGESEKRALEVVGDVVAEYLRHGEGRKFICSAVDTTHVEELQRQFLSAGINVASYTYKDDDEDRAETVTEFRKMDSAIKGLITVTAASRGFDVPSVSCIIMARPLRKSLAEHIQLFGRGLRICEGKKNCLVLDHSGNMARFWQDMNEFFEVGVTQLDDGKKKDKPKPKEKAEAEPVKCPSCRALHKPMPFCPACGHEYPKKRAIEHVPGTLKELIATGNQHMLRARLWPQIVGYVLERREGDQAQRMAQAIYKNMTGEFARARVDTTTPAPCSYEVRQKIRAGQIRRSYAQRSQHGAAA